MKVLNKVITGTTIVDSPDTIFSCFSVFVWDFKCCQWQGSFFHNVFFLEELDFCFMDLLYSKRFLNLVLVFQGYRILKIRMECPLWFKKIKYYVSEFKSHYYCGALGRLCMSAPFCNFWGIIFIKNLILRTYIWSF